MHRTISILVGIALVGTSCGEAQREDPPAPPAPPAAAAAGADHPAALLARWRARVGDSVLVRRGACPFECCVYGRWAAETRIPLLAQPRAGGEAILSLEPGSRFAADSGFVRVTGTALVAVTAPVEVRPGGALQPGDTLLLLDYVGEGVYNAWLNGEEVEVAAFWGGEVNDPRGELIGEHATEWWVRATAEGGEVGWFRADAEGVEIGGADACAGPAPVQPEAPDPLPAASSRPR